MNKFKNAAIGIGGIILMITIVSALIPMTGHGQGGTIAKDVAVVNTPSVNVTNPVGLATGTTVGIDSSNNTVKLDPNYPVTVRGEQTEVILNQVVAASCCPPTLSTKVDVSAYKQIRIVVKSENGNDSGVWITPQLRLDDTQQYWGERIPLDDAQPNSLNKVYDTPGRFVQVLLQGDGNMRVVIFGRRN